MKNTPVYLSQILDSLLSSTTDSIAIFANTTAFINEFIPNINWVGIYRMVNDQLILGPFQGKSACVYIPLGKGACGRAAQENTIVVLDDVSKVDNYIACHSETQSEIVIPIALDGKVVAVLDIDSLELGRFSDIDIQIFQALVDVVAKHLSVAIL